MSTNWLFLIVIAGLSSNFFNTILRQTLKDGHDSTAYSWWFEVFRLIFFLFLLPWDHTYSSSIPHLFWLLVLGLSEVVGVYTFMKMHASTELSISTIIMRLRNIWIAILAFVFLGERLNALQYFGVATIVLGTLILHNFQSLRVDKSLKNTLIFTLVSAVSVIVMKHTTTYASTSIVSLAFSLPAAILLPLLMKDPLSRLRSSLVATARSLLTASFFNNLTMLLLVAALKITNASQAMGVLQGVTMLTVVTGIIFLHERDHLWRKLLSALVTTIGIILLV